MTTLTQRKRAARPEHYARKDARTVIYNALYGYGGKTYNDPHSDEGRNKDCTYQGALARIEDEDLMALANFSQQELAEIERRLEALRIWGRKSKSMEGAE